MEIESLHLPRGRILHAPCVIDEQKDNPFCWMLCLLTADEFLEKSLPLAIDGAMIPGRFSKEPGHTTQIPMCFRLAPHLGDGFPSITQDDAVHNGKKVIHLWLRKTELQKQNEVDDIRIARYHRLGQSFLRRVWVW